MKIKKKDKWSVIKFIIFIVAIIGIIFIAIKAAPWLIDMAKNPINVRKYMLSVGFLGEFFFILMLILHVVIVVVLGDILYVLGGFVFGMPKGFILSYIGVVLGGFLVFNFSRFLGYDFISKLIPKEKLEKAKMALNSVNGMLGLFILCVLPIIPKSLFMYVAGLTPIKATRFFPVYALSRIPVTFMWASVGANVYEKDYNQMTIMLIILAILTLVGFIVNRKISKSKK